MPGSKLFVTVIGGDTCSEEVAQAAFEVGRELARRGAVIFCGGRGGVMEAVCRGAKTEGGVTVGILPGADPREANPFVDIPIPTGMGNTRNALVVRAGQVVIAIDGHYGTLSEIGLALNLGIPVVGLWTWQLLRQGHLPDEGIVVATSPQEAVEKALALAEGSPPNLR